MLAIAIIMTAILALLGILALIYAFCGLLLGAGGDDLFMGVISAIIAAGLAFCIVGTWVLYIHIP